MGLGHPVEAKVFWRGPTVSGSSIFGPTTFWTTNQSMGLNCSSPTIVKGFRHPELFVKQKSVLSILANSAMFFKSPTAVEGVWAVNKVTELATVSVSLVSNKLSLH